ncbi:Rubrerythrin [Caloranaerobacter azorensis DSM 13643]|uniref:Rubrerythrin n=1 Tax=Caloranaerobacter azorensis DSM 13643 TaxID=1121264 RepID=A0A1M5UIP6_9FIRM|nr:ferritin-like domain-containing protein [Caloranaerobacter azorensis]SHH62914.1 Rubrerythrin [Caloranaerobacter azorensis DSM 13643]
MYYYGITPNQLIQAMKGELEAIEYYERLIKMAPNREEANIIRAFYEDEKKHYNNFRRLYMMMTGRPPIILPVNKPKIKSYLQGIEQAILDELKAYEFYRDIYLSNINPYVRNTFFEAFTDENEHAAHLNYIYTKNKCK